MRPPSRTAAVIAATLFVGIAMAAPYKYEKQYKSAVKAEVAGDVLGALTAFEAIPLADRDIATRVHIASCKRKLNRLLEADRDLAVLLETAGLDQAWRETIESDRTSLDERIPKLELSSKVALDTSVVVAVAGSVAAVPSTLRLDPGQYVVTATRAGDIVFERKVDLDTSSRVAVVIEVQPLAIPTKVAPPPIVTPARESERQMPAWPFLAASGVFIGGFIGARIAVGSASTSVQTNCLAQHTFECDYDAAGKGRVRTYEALSFVAGGAALAAAGIGIAILVSPAKAPTTASISPTVGAVNGISIWGSF